MNVALLHENFDVNLYICFAKLSSVLIVIHDRIRTEVYTKAPSAWHLSIIFLISFENINKHNA
jgi:hypothetical protein